MKQTTLLHKFVLGLIAGLVAGANFRRLGSKYLTNLIPQDLVFIISYLLLLTGLVVAYLWHYQEKKNVDTSTYKVWIEQLTAFTLALDLTMFGIHKFLKLQMIVPLGMLDSPLSSFSGENLVWAFFRYSYAFTTVIALLQIASAIMLLFAKTRLFGCMMVLPMLIFISLMDFFYQMPIGVLLHGLILLSAIVYFLWLYRQQLLSIFLIDASSEKAPVNWLWLSLLVCVPILCLTNLNHPDKHPKLTGKYSVENLKIDGVLYKASTSSDSVLTAIYFDLDDDIVFRWNDYRRQRIGRYQLREDGKIQMQWRFPSTAVPMFNGKLVQMKDTLSLKGQMDKKKYEMLLIKQTKARY